MARLLAEEIGKRIGQSIIVQNRPGAGGNIGMAQAARSRPDGYTLVISWTGPLATNLALYRDVGYDPRRDLAPVGMVGCTPNVLAVSATSPARDLSLFMEGTRDRGSQVSYGTTGVGSSWHIAGEMVNLRIGNRLTHVPYTTPSAALSDLLGGRLDAIFPVVPMTVPHVQAGTIRVLAVFSERRSSVLPEVPTTAELGHPELVSETCFALLAPNGTPATLIERLNLELNAILAEPDMRARIEAMGVSVSGGPPADLSRYLEREIPRQAEIVAASGAKAD
ncbi:Bug family tripartite tricarboxylate transporter substrate binding protein [Sabulicella rubraurantiaca]|uniref:Bug family tripartite tricarboxylate transporter substrate binding protein n=1 Tax=Sabulicella rubraurantiaca TaxID=2811429 RepID=UPI001A979F55|nr:tripartite tricarboxylate transporter substrate binding protein [Sabulicella rubraurantiaca]